MAIFPPLPECQGGWPLSCDDCTRDAGCSGRGVFVDALGSRLGKKSSEMQVVNPFFRGMRYDPVCFFCELEEMFVTVDFIRMHTHTHTKN